MRIKDLAKEEAEKTLQRLKVLIEKRTAKDKKIKQNLEDLALERKERQSRL